MFPDSPDLGFSNVQAPTTPTPVLGSDRHLSTLAGGSAAAIATGEYLELYGTDNPSFVGPAPAAPVMAVPDTSDLGYSAVDLGFAAPASSDLGYSAVPSSSDYMALYGTDNPVFVEATEHPLADFYG